MKSAKAIILFFSLMLIFSCVSAPSKTIPPYDPPVDASNLATVIISDGILIKSMDNKDFWKNGKYVSNTTIQVPIGEHVFSGSFYKKTKTRVYKIKEITFTGTFEYGKTYSINYLLRPFIKDVVNVDILIEENEDIE